MNNRISAAILAGGPASRMGGVVKPNLVICGETIITITLSLLKELFSEIIIVTNAPDEFTQYSECMIIKDRITGIGPLGGIHAALNAASCDAVFVFAGDMPLLNRSLIKKQIEFFEANSCDILVPKTGKSIEPLHSIYKRSILDKLDEYLSGKNDYAVRQFFRIAETRYMEIDDTEVVRNIFANINRPSDIPAIERIFFN